MDNTTSTGNSEARSSGFGLTRLMLSRTWDSGKVTVDKSTTSNTTTSNISSSVNESSSSGVGGPLTRTLHQLGRLFNSGYTGGVSASVLPEKGSQTTPTITKSPKRSLPTQKSLPWDTLSPMDDSFSRRGSFGRTYSFTRCASFSHSNSFSKPQQSS